MIRITVACAAGMSTSLLVSKMEKHAVKEQLNVSILAVPEKQFEKYLEETDILLLGPQISFLETRYKQMYDEAPLIITSIAAVDYGRMDGEKVLNKALSLLKGGKTNG